MARDPSEHPRGADPMTRGKRPPAKHNPPQMSSAPADDLPADLLAVLESAARLQELVPDTVLVGGSAAAMYAGHRTSFDHDHVLVDLRDRFDLVLDALEREEGWVTNRTRPGKIILGEIGDIEAGVRQLIRSVPLETQEVALPSSRKVRVPTPEETLRVKAFLVVKRNQTRDYLDVAALANRYGYGAAARTLADIDRFYTDPAKPGTPVADQVIRQLAAPRPKDSRVTKGLSTYKALEPRWHDWAAVVEACQIIARRIDEEDWE